MRTSCWLRPGQKIRSWPHLLSWYESCHQSKRWNPTPRCCFFFSIHPPTPPPPLFWILIDIRFTCDRIWCKVKVYSSEIIHYKSFPLRRVKSFIHSLMRLVIQRSMPWLLTNMSCHSTRCHALDALWCPRYCNSSPLSINKKKKTRLLA